MFSRTQSTERDLQWAAVLLALTCLAYLPVFHAGFVADDHAMVVNNPLLRTSHGLYLLSFTADYEDPQPLTLGFLWLQWHLWQASPLGYHIVNVISHFLAAWLFWRVLEALPPSPARAFPGTWLAAAAFAVHPVCVASAASIAEQKNTDSILFYLLALLWYLRFENGRKNFYWVSLLAFGAALLCKGSVVMLPVILLLIVAWRNGRITAQDFLRTAPFFLLSFGKGLQTIWVQNRFIAQDMIPTLDFPGRVAAAARVVWFYLWKDWVPLNVWIVYPQWHVDSRVIVTWLPAAALLVVFFLCWRWRASWGRNVLLGLGCFVVTLFPVMGFFNMLLLQCSRVWNEWQYLALLPSVALGVCGAAWCMERLVLRFHLPKMAVPIGACAMLASLSLSTTTLARAYKSDDTLWAYALKKNQDSWFIYVGMANNSLALGRPDEAIALYEKALRLKPDDSVGQSDLAMTLAKTGRLDAAVPHLQKAIELQPRRAAFHFNYGIILVPQGRLDAAAAEYNTAIQLKPDFTEARNNLVNVLLMQNKFQEALDQALIAVRLQPNDPGQYANAASALWSMGKTNQAAACFEAALRVQPDFLAANFNYGLLLEESGNLAGAEARYKAAASLAPENANIHFHLGCVLEREGKRGPAVGEFKEALRLDPGHLQARQRLDTLISQHH
jgi:protein O-mannosyl-transferase